MANNGGTTPVTLTGTHTVHRDLPPSERHHVAVVNHTGTGATVGEARVACAQAISNALLARLLGPKVAEAPDGTLYLFVDTGGGTDVWQLRPERESRSLHPYAAHDGTPLEVRNQYLAAGWTVIGA